MNKTEVSYHKRVREFKKGGNGLTAILRKNIWVPGLRGGVMVTH